MERLGSLWTDFHDIWYLGIFRKYFEKFQVSLTYDKNYGQFAWRPIYKVVQIWPGLVRLVYTQISPGHIWTTLYIFHYISLTSYNETCCRSLRFVLKGLILCRLYRRTSCCAYVICGIARCGNERDSRPVQAIEGSNDSEKKRKVKGVRIIVKGRVISVNMVM
jgi:hypothetical protein